jgi:hypothetical protein
LAAGTWNEQRGDYEEAAESLDAKPHQALFTICETKNLEPNPSSECTDQISGDSASKVHNLGELTFN